MTTSRVPIDPILDGLNDNLVELTRNGRSTLGNLQRAIANTVLYRQHQGRPLGHFWGGWDTNARKTGATTFRLARFDMLDGGCANYGMFSHLISTDIGGGISSTSGVYVNGVQSTAGKVPNTSSYPDGLQLNTAKTAERAPAVGAGGTSETILGFDSVYPMSGCIFEDAVDGVADLSTTLAISGLAGGRDIIATQTGSYATMDRLVDRFMHVWRNRRTTYTWFAPEDDYVELATSSHAYRYIFDQTVGTGGTAPSSTGPAITLPARFSAAGLETSVRVYVWVYAAMSGTTDSGTIAIANKATGTMGAMTALTHPQTIGGTGFAWYPSLGTFDPTAVPYFTTPTNLLGSEPFDRVCLGGRSEGTTDKLRIRGWMMAIYPDRS